MRKEPLIKVGIILPEDKKSKIIIELPKNKIYKLNGSLVSNTIITECKSNKIYINDQDADQFKIEPINGLINKDFAIINSVPTGRGFHWQKEIAIQISGNILISSKDGYLFIINELPTEDYLPYVATAEMNPDCPTAFLETQTIAARSWLLANRNVNHPELEIDVCNDDCCQRYQGFADVPVQSLQAIQNTLGQVLQYKNRICDARYSKCCGGITESFENVWGTEPIPYLSSVTDIQKSQDHIININNLDSYFESSPAAYCSPQFVKPSEYQKYLGKVDQSKSYYRWKITYTQQELTSIINSKLNLDANKIQKLSALKRGFSGRIISLKIEYIDNLDLENSIIINSEYEIRNALHEQFLYSSAFIIEQNNEQQNNPESFKFVGAGWGHGVGMCQIGALGMALQGKSPSDILQHYYKNTKIEKIY